MYGALIGAALGGLEGTAEGWNRADKAIEGFKEREAGMKELAKQNKALTTIVTNALTQGTISPAPSPSLAPAS